MEQAQYWLIAKPLIDETYLVLPFFGVTVYIDDPVEFGFAVSTRCFLEVRR